MTVSHHAPALAARDLPTAVNALRARGLRVSAARRLVLEALFAAGEPVTAEDIAAGLGGRLPLSDLASVYRNLDTLEAFGLVRHVHLGHGPGRYAVRARGGTSAFAACERCGASTELTAATVDRIADVVRDACGYEPRFAHFALPSLCPDCANSHEDRHAHP